MQRRIRGRAPRFFALGIFSIALVAVAASQPTLAVEPNVVLTPGPGIGIGFNGNNGPYNPASPALAPDNLARATRGALPLGSSALGTVGTANYQIANINDGIYGDRHAWIGASGDASPFIGVAFSGPVAMDSLAWSRDNGDDVVEGHLGDRDMGLYLLQITRIVNPSAATSETGNPLTGWSTFATIDYRNAEPGVFDPELRHQFVVRENGLPIVATGFRIRPPASGLAAGTAIDEIEVYGTSVPEPFALSLAGCGLFLVVMGRRSRVASPN